jgi:hypothetical protein
MNIIGQIPLQLARHDKITIDPKILQIHRFRCNMKKLEWPGIATAAVLICAATIVVAIWRDPDGFRLKDWQTFMAACVALVGGVMAYRGAMAKVEFDRYAHDKKIEREELGTYLRLRSTLSFVLQFSQVASQKLNTFHFTHSDQTLEVASLHPRMTFDVNEAWNNLDMFEPDVAKDIAEIKTNLDGFYVAIDDYGAAVWTKTYVTPAPDDARSLNDLVDRLVKYSKSIIQGIDRDMQDY